MKKKEKTFRSLKEYLDYYSKGNVKVKGSKYYKIGVEIAREAIAKIEGL